MPIEKRTRKEYTETLNNLTDIFDISASNVAGEPPYYLALPPTYNVTWWRTQRFRNGSLSPDKNRNYTEFTDSLNDAEIVSRPPSPQSIQVSYKFTILSFLSAILESEVPSIFEPSCYYLS